MVMAITHIWVSGSIIHKSKHQVHKITSPEAELFAIRCYAVGMPDCQSVVTDSLTKYDIIRLVIILLIALCIPDLHVHLLLTCHYHLSNVCRNSETISFSRTHSSCI